MSVKYGHTMPPATELAVRVATRVETTVFLVSLTYACAEPRSESPQMFAE